MLEGWRHATVEEICQRVSVGIVIKPSQYYVENGEGIRAFRSANIGENKVVDRDWVYLSNAGHEANKKSALREGDVLVVRSGAPGTACVVPKDFAGSNCIDVVFARPDRSQVLPEYLASYTNSDVGKQHVLGNKGGLALQHFNVGAYKEMLVLLPPLPEQRKIAEILRTWDEALEKLTALRAAKARRLGAVGCALLDRAADDPATVTKPLADLVRIVKGQQLNKLDISDGDYPVWNGGITPSGFHDEWNTEGGTITISEGGNSCGFVNLAHRPFWLGGHCYALQGLSKVVERDFLFHVLKSREAEIMRLRVGSGLPNIQRGDLERLPVVVPPQDLQGKIANALTAGNAEISLLDAEIEALTRQKRGLMQKLLTGEWRVKLEESVA